MSGFEPLQRAGLWFVTIEVYNQPSCSWPQLADTHLAAAAKATRRIEQILGAVTEEVEDYFSWTVGAVVELVNNGLLYAETDERPFSGLAG